MEALYAWLESLICYFILLFAVMNCLPDNSYRKYIQYYMGLLLILVVLSPLLHLSGMEGQIAAYTKEFQEEAQEWEEKQKPGKGSGRRRQGLSRGRR